MWPLCLKTSACFLAVSRLALARCKKLVIFASHTLLGHTDKLFFKYKEGKQTNKRKKTPVNTADNNEGRYESASGKWSFGKKPPLLVTHFTMQVARCLAGSQALGYYT